MVELYLYVEGGGDAASLKAKCREGFSEFLRKAGLEGRMPRIVACGSRKQAYDRFRTAIREREHSAMILVDSEDPVSGKSPWAHLRQRQDDRWETPPGANDDDCHLMVECMEAWFLADRRTLAAFFGQGFNANPLRTAATSVEQVPKASVLQALAVATKGCAGKGAYGKGRHSFELLAKIDPAEVTAASHWAARFVTALKTRMGA
jgi:hypothetical protein